MSLTETFVREVNSIKKTGDNYTDGDGMYLLVTPTGKYWRLDYRHLGKRKTLALRVYPSTILAKARAKRSYARAQFADGIDRTGSTRICSPTSARCQSRPSSPLTSWAPCSASKHAAHSNRRTACARYAGRSSDSPSPAAWWTAMSVQTSRVH